MRHEKELVTITPEELAGLGSDQIAYMKEMLSDDVTKLFPNAGNIPPKIKVWVLFSADGTPLALAGDPGEVFSSAFHHDLQPVSLH